jgi:HlyD family secretion protein
MRKKRKVLMRILVLLFIIVNIVLVGFDKDGKVNRSAYVSDWKKVYQSNLYETVKAKGVVSYSGEDYVYFDKSIGSFDKFLVEAGSEISEGDPLFTYRVHDYAETEAFLTYELSKIEGEVSAIEDAISEMVAYQIPKSSVPVMNNKDEKTTVVVTQPDPIESEVMKEQFIIQKEQELAAKKEQHKVVESQLKDLRDGGDTVTIASPFHGNVKEISSSLNDPIMVIENTDLQVKAEVNETERLKVEEGQDVKISLLESGQTLKGTVSSVGKVPHEVDIHANSIYPFDVTFQEGETVDAIIPGYHTELDITVKEALNTPTIRKGQVHHNKVWRLDEKGRLVNVPVQTGIKMENQVEVVSGLAIGNVLASEEMPSSYDGMPYITPLKFQHIPWSKIGTYKDWKKYMMIGILVR